MDRLVLGALMLAGMLWLLGVANNALDRWDRMRSQRDLVSPPNQNDDTN